MAILSESAAVAGVILAGLAGWLASTASLWTARGLLSLLVGGGLAFAFYKLLPVGGGEAVGGRPAVTLPPPWPALTPACPSVAPRKSPARGRSARVGTLTRGRVLRPMGNGAFRRR